LLTQPSYAQQLPESPRQKAEEAGKKAYQKDTDEAYKAAMKRTRDTNKKVDDPWGRYERPRQAPVSKLTPNNAGQATAGPAHDGVSWLLLDSKPLRVLRKRNNSTRERAN
jgi:hypothetical protein